MAHGYYVSPVDIPLTRLAPALFEPLGVEIITCRVFLMPYAIYIYVYIYIYTYIHTCIYIYIYRDIKCNRMISIIYIYKCNDIYLCVSLFTYIMGNSGMCLVI